MPSGRLTVVRDVHDANVPFPIEVTFFGTVIYINLEQPRNALLLTVVRLSGNVIEVSEVQFKNA